MKRVPNFHRKRPHLLPPLQNSQRSSLNSVNPLRPPDILLTKRRFGSPIPRPNDPREFDYVGHESNDNPIIRINEPKQNENKDCSLMKIDLLSGTSHNETHDLSYQKENLFKTSGLDSQGDNLLFENLPKKQFEKFPDLEQNIKFQKILPLEELGKTTTSKTTYLQIPNRYKLLKPIGEGIFKSHD